MGDFQDGFKDEEEEEEEPEFMYGGRDGLIFLVDSSLPMFVRGVEDEVPFKTCIECCKTTMLNKIISSDRDLVAVVLFGTNTADNELNAAHITRLQELSEPSADKIKQLEKMAKSEDFDGFAAKYGHSSDFALSDALWLCQTMFSKSVYKLSSYRIFLMTNTSDPHLSDANKQHQARVRASDLSQAGINLELLHMGQHFDTSLFYKELVELSTGESGDDYELPDPASRIEELLERICRVDGKKRAICELSFSLGQDVAIGVNLYNLARKMTLPKQARLDQASNEPVTAVKQLWHPVTAEIMLPSELSYGLSIADETVKFTHDEKRVLRSMSPVGLALLGFKPSDEVKFYEHISPSAFIYPAEEFIQGSRVLFVALLERCAARSVAPICYLTTRINTSPKLVALLPQLEEIKKGLQMAPPGFHVVFLPFRDYIALEVLEETSHSKLAQIALLKEMTSKLLFRYKVTLFDNPNLQVHWSNLEALALDQLAPREVIDYTVPNLVEMKKKLRGSVERFLTSLYAAGYDPLSTKKPAAKRAATGAAAGRRGKVLKVESGSQTLGDEASRLSQISQL